MPIESAVQKIVDPNYVFETVTEVRVEKEGLIFNPFARNAITHRSMFLRNGVKVRYEYECPEFAYDSDDYAIGRAPLYFTSKQFVMLCLK